jgi:hypothetical protein
MSLTWLIGKLIEPSKIDNGNETRSTHPKFDLVNSYPLILGLFENFKKPGAASLSEPGLFKKEAKRTIPKKDGTAKGSESIVIFLPNVIPTFR